MPPSDDAPLLRLHGNYRQLLSDQKAEVIFDLTSRFTKRFPQKGDRTIDQMRQAARSGKQNILEGLWTSRETELKLTTWLAPVWRNFTATTKIAFERAICRAGLTIRARLSRARSRRPAA